MNSIQLLRELRLPLIWGSLQSCLHRCSSTRARYGEIVFLQRVGPIRKGMRVVKPMAR